MKLQSKMVELSKVFLQQAIDKVVGWIYDDGTQPQDQEEGGLLDLLDLEGGIVPTEKDWDFTAEYGVEIRQRSLYLQGEIEDESVNLLIQQMRLMDLDDSKPIFLFIDTEGGSMGAGMKLCDVMQCFIKSPIVGVVTGKCASMGLPVLLSCDHRISTPNSYFLVHEGSYSVGGDRGKNKDQLEFLEKGEEIYWKAFRDKLSKETCDGLIEKAMGKRKEVYLDPQEALALGIVNEICSKIRKEKVKNGQYPWVRIKKGEKSKKKIVVPKVPKEKEKEEDANDDNQE